MHSYCYAVNTICVFFTSVNYQTMEFACFTFNIRYSKVAVAAGENCRRPVLGHVQKSPSNR